MNPRVLIVDDDKDVLEILDEEFKQHGCSCIAVNDPAEAISKFREQNDFDLVVTDYKMPKQNGAKVIEEIRKVNATVPIILVTAFASADMLREVRDFGANGYLAKPLCSEKVEEILVKFGAKKAA